MIYPVTTKHAEPWQIVTKHVGGVRWVQVRGKVGGEHIRAGCEYGEDLDVETREEAIMFAKNLAISRLNLSKPWQPSPGIYSTGLPNTPNPYRATPATRASQPVRPRKRY